MAYGFMSPMVCPSKTAYAVAFECTLASMWYTQVFAGIPVRLAVTLLQDAPASVVI